VSLPDRSPTDLVGQPAPVPAHHRPPNVVYSPDGVPYHFTVGQPPPPAHITVQLPEAQGMSPQQREFMMYVIMWLVVAVVLVACVCAVTVIMGGTLMGIIGALGQNAAMIGVSFVGIILATGWAATKIKPLMKTKKG
jgi:hypothetical protein